MTLPHFHANIGFNAHHSPMAAYFSFTCGHPGTRGGMGVELGKPADQDIFVGYKDGDRYADVPLKVLPFFNGADAIDPAAAYLPEKKGEDRQRFAPFKLEEMRRQYGWATDRWTAPSMEFSIYTPFSEIPEPGVGSEEDLPRALAPAIAAEVRVDNRTGTTSKTGFFALNFHDGGLRVLELEGNRVGFGFRREFGITGEIVEIGEDNRCAAKVPNAAFVFIKWWPHEGLEDRSNPIHLLGTCGGIGFEVPPGKHYALRLTLACHLDGIVTTGLEGRYFYNRYFSSLESVLNYAAPLFSTFKKAAGTLDKELLASGLSADQQFLIAHATRSYYGNTQLLEIENAPYWIVNEGEYRMMNTLDLAVDHVFWELERNPWVVRNLLDNFLKRYSYRDMAWDSEITGGISFSHDQGTHNQFSPFGSSAYELPNMTGCFSYMTYEELCNWILMAASYAAKTGDKNWVRANSLAIKNSFASLLQRRGDREGNWMKTDSPMCGSGQEITTYDSLDSSLGQARENLYLAMKEWAAYHAIELLSYAGTDVGEIAHDAGNEIDYLGVFIRKELNEEGVLPALFEKDSAGYHARILPAIEGLVYTLYWSGQEYILPAFRNALNPGENEVSWFANALRLHASTLLSDVKRRNKFSDEGIKLSSTSNNSWLSKIAIVQHVARAIFNLNENGQTRTPNPESRTPTACGWEKADAAHVKWLTTGQGAYWCACDQIVNGEAKGSKYYPRLITTALWLREVQK